jgi:hypothetical protein
LGKEDEGGEAVLGAISEEAGATPSGGERRRPWRRLGYWEENGEERSARKRKKEGGVAWRAGILQGVFSSSRRQAGRGSPAALRKTRRCAAYWKKKKEGFCRKTP